MTVLLAELKKLVTVELIFITPQYPSPLSSIVFEAQLVRILSVSIRIN